MDYSNANFVDMFLRLFRIKFWAAFKNVENSINVYLTKYK